MTPTEPFVRSILEPYEPELCDLLHASWNAATSTPGWAAFDYKRTRATVMHQIAMNTVRDHLSGRGDVHLMPGPETIRLLIQRQLVVRLKKMDRRGFTRAQPTQAQMAFTNETPLTLPLGDEFPDVYVIDFGYVLNELETRIDSVLVAARYGEAVVWSYEADRGDGARVAGFVPPAALPPHGAANVIRLPVNTKDRKDNGRK